MHDLIALCSFLGSSYHLSKINRACRPDYMGRGMRTTYLSSVGNTCRLDQLFSVCRGCCYAELFRKVWCLFMDFQENDAHQGFLGTVRNIGLPLFDCRQIFCSNTLSGA